MRFLVDAQLPPTLARLLTAHGHVAEHVADIGPGDATDLVIWRCAFENGAIIVTKDEDFPDMPLAADAAPSVVWVRVGNTRRTTLLAWFEPLIDRIVAMVEAGDQLAELR